MSWSVAVMKVIGWPGGSVSIRCTGPTGNVTRGAWADELGTAATRISTRVDVERGGRPPSLASTFVGNNSVRFVEKYQFKLKVYKSSQM